MNFYGFFLGGSKGLESGVENQRVGIFIGHSNAYCLGYLDP